MSDFPGTPDAVTDPSFIHTWMPLAPGIVRGCIAVASGAALSSLTWVANLAIWMPVNIPWPYPVRRVFWGNGSTITSSNAEFAIYNANGVRIYTTGSTALSGVSAPQFVDPTDFLLSAGRYYFAYTCDNTTNRARGVTTFTTTILRQSGVYQKAGVAPGALPTTMVGVGAATQALYPLCGITRTSSGF